MKSIFTSCVCLSLILAPVLNTEAEFKTGIKKTTRVHDVTLHSSGSLEGLVVNSQGEALDGAQVSIRKNNREIALTVTNRDGKFRVSNLTTGIYELRSGQGHGVVRVWAEEAAPPAAKPRVLLVNGKLTARAQAGLLEEIRVVDFAILGLSITSVALSGVALGKDTKTIIVSP